MLVLIWLFVRLFWIWIFVCLYLIWVVVWEVVRLDWNVLQFFSYLIYCALLKRNLELYLYTGALLRFILVNNFLRNLWALKELKSYTRSITKLSRHVNDSLTDWGSIRTSSIWHISSYSCCVSWCSFRYKPQDSSFFWVQTSLRKDISLAYWKSNFVLHLGTCNWHQLGWRVLMLRKSKEASYTTLRLGWRRRW